MLRIRLHPLLSDNADAIAEPAVRVRPGPMRLRSMPHSDIEPDAPLEDDGDAA